MRWTEEVVLLREEMRRVVAYHSWHIGWWKEQATRWPDLSAPETEGMMAYAERQASLRSTMRDFCRHTWRDADLLVHLGAGTGHDTFTNMDTSV